MTNHMMNYKIADIEGIGPEFSRKLEEVGVNTTNDLLAKASSLDLRRQLAEKTGVSEALLTRWVHMADLMRLKGIGPQYSELLLAAGVPSLEKLGTFKPDELVQMLVKVNMEKKLAKATPTLGDVETWMRTLGESKEFATSH